MREWTAVVLAAGRGSRLRPLTADRPKPLVEVGGRPLLAHLLERCRDAGARSAVVVVGDRGHAIRGWLARHAPLPCRAVDNPHHATRGNGWSLHVARGAVDTPWCVKLDGDLLLSPSVLPGLLAGASGPGLAYDPRAALDGEAMKVRCEAGRVTALGKALPAADGESMGVELLDGDALCRVAAAIEAVDPEAYYEDAYQRCIDEGWYLDAVPLEAPWLEIDDPADHRRAETAWAAGNLA